jgi:4-amino-4-deoxy-L-arabinose transferase-like glycosyltransferase
MLRKIFEKVQSGLERRWKLLLAILLILQIAISVAVFIAYGGFVLTNDSPSYTSPAVNLIHYGHFIDEYGETMLFRTPGYPFFLAAVYLLGGNHTAVAVVQLVLSLSATLLIFGIVRRVTGTRWAGVLAVLFYTLDYIHYYHSLNIGADVLFAYLLLVSAFFLVKWMTDHRRWRWFLLTAVFLQLAGLVKPTLMYYLMILAAVLLLLTLLKKLSWKSLVTYLVTFAVCFGGWCARNYAQSGYFMLSNIRYMQVFNFDSRDLMAQIEGIPVEDAMGRLERMLEDKYGDTSGMSVMELNECKRDIGGAYVKSHLGAYLVMNVKGLFLLMLGPGRSPLSEIIHNDFALKLAFLFNSGILLLLYLVYAVSFLRRLRKVTWFEWLLFLTTCYLIAATAAMGYQRYRISFYPLVLLGAALALARVCKKPDTAIENGNDSAAR